MGISYKAIVNGKCLMHFNPYHDKKGKFAKSPYGSDSAATRKVISKMYADYDADEKAAKAASGNKKHSKGDLSKGLTKTGETLSKAARNASNIRLHGKQKKTDLSQYSDQELQRIVNRLGNEQRYEQLTRSENVNKGQKFVDGLVTALTIAGGVVTLAGGAAGAYNAFTGKNPIDLFKKKS